MIRFLVIASLETIRHTAEKNIRPHIVSLGTAHAQAAVASATQFATQSSPQDINVHQSKHVRKKRMRSIELGTAIAGDVPILWEVGAGFEGPKLLATPCMAARC